MEKIKILCIVGPTASGKSALALELAKRLADAGVTLRFFTAQHASFEALKEQTEEGEVEN